MNSMTKDAATFVGTTIKEFQGLSGLLDRLTGAMSHFGTEPIIGGSPFNPALLGSGPPVNSPSEMLGFPKPKIVPGNSPIEMLGFPKTAKPPATKMPPTPEEIQRLKDYNDEKERQRKTIEAVISALELQEISTVGLSNVQKQIAIELDRAGVSATSAEGEKITARVQKLEMLKAAQESVTFAAQQSAQKQQVSPTV